VPALKYIDYILFFSAFSLELHNKLNLFRIKLKALFDCL